MKLARPCFDCPVLGRKLPRAAHNTVSAMEHSRYDVTDEMVQAYRERYGWK